MKTSWTILHEDGRYFKNGKTTVTHIEKATVYTEIATLYKFAVPHFEDANGDIEYGPHLLWLGYNDENEIAFVLDMGELWAALRMYSLGVEVGKYKAGTENE